jgi:F-type H+-transporting ATPase subunit b
LEINWSTFGLEIINFLVLIWILKRFIYKPVLSVIAQRRTAIENQSTEAQRLHEEAVDLKIQYQNRLSDWEQERQQARDAINQELKIEKARQLQALQEVLTQEREKAKTADERRRIENVREIEHQALRQGAEFASRLLNMAGGPELEARLILLLVEELGTLNPQQILSIQNRWGDNPKTINVCSVYPVAGKQKQLLETALTDILGQSLPVNYSEVPELLAGLHISIGAWVLQANVRDELKGFAEFAHVAR